MVTLGIFGIYAAGVIAGMVGFCIVYMWNCNHKPDITLQYDPDGGENGDGVYTLVVHCPVQNLKEVKYPRVRVVRFDK